MNLYLKKQNLFWQKIAVRFFILLIFIAMLNVFHAQIRSSFFYLSSPLSENFLDAGSATASFFQSFLHIGNLPKENALLSSQNAELLARIAALEDQVDQQQTLHGALENTAGDNLALSMVRVIGLDASRDTILIDKGSADGIFENMPLISKEKIVYGKVSKVYHSFSQATLISAANEVLNVKVLSFAGEQNNPEQKPVYGAIKGSGNAKFYLDLINSDSIIQSGDILITSALEGIYPPNLLVGKIETVSHQDAKPFQQASAQPFFDLQNIENLFIITNYKK